MASRKNAPPAVSAAYTPPAEAGVAAAMPAATAAGAKAAGRPAIGAGIPEYFLAPTKGSGAVLYKPMIAGFAKLHFVDSKLALDEWQTSGWLAPLDDGSGDASWEDAARDAQLKSRLAPSPAPEAEYAELPGVALRAASYAGWAQGAADASVRDGAGHTLLCRCFQGRLEGRRK